MKAKKTPRYESEKGKSTIINNGHMNTAKAPNIKHDSPEVKDVVNFADRFWYVLELKIKKLKIAIQKSDNHYLIWIRLGMILMIHMQKER